MLYKFQIFFVIVLISLAAGCSRDGKSHHADTQESEGPLTLAKVNLESLDGKPLPPDSLAGKAVFLNLWATWCKPCLKEMPSIKNLQQTSDAGNIVFLFASDEEAKRIAEFESNNNFNFNYVRITNIASLDVSVLPVTYLFDGNGKMVMKETGYRDWATPESIQLIKTSLQ